MTVAATGTYSDLQWPIGTYTDYKWTVTPRTDPSPDGYFWSHQFWFPGGDGGYAGMQTLGTGLDGKCVVFSIAGAINAIGSGIVSPEFDGAPGYSTRIDYDWAVGRSYQFYLEKTTSDGTGHWWMCSVTDLVTSVTEVIASIKVPVGWGDLGDYSILWSERYSGPSPLLSCEQMEHSIVDFTDLFVDTSTAPDSITNHPSSPVNCDNWAITNITEGVRQEMGVPQLELPTTFMLDRFHPELVWVDDVEGEQIGPLHNLDDLYIETKLNSERILYFSIIRTDPKAVWIASDRTCRYKDEVYRIGKIVDGRTSTGETTMVVRCNALWYDLAGIIKLLTFSLSAKTTLEGITTILEDTGWTVGDVVNPSAIHSYEIRNASVLEILRAWATISGGELVFDTVDKVVHIVPMNGEDYGIGFRHGRNIETITRTYDPPSATRLYPLGANDLGILGVNPTGLPYVENYSWYVDQGISLDDAQLLYTKELIWEDPKYILDLDLYDAAVARLAVLSQPIISYEATVMDLSAITGVAEDAFEVGDLVGVDDADLGISIQTRVVRIVRRPYAPWNNIIELSYYRPGLNLESFLGTSSTNGSEFRLVVDESMSKTISSSVNHLLSLDFTVGNTANGAGTFHFIGTATGTGTLHIQMLLDGVQIGGEEIHVFTNGQIISTSPNTFFSGLEGGDHGLELVGYVTAGSGTVHIEEYQVRGWAVISGTLGGGGSGGTPRATVEDIVPDETVMPTGDSGMIVFFTDEVATLTDTVTDETVLPTETVSVSIV